MRNIQGLLRIIGFAGILATGAAQAVAAPLLASVNQNTNSLQPAANQPTNPPLGSVNQTSNPAPPGLNPNATQMPNSLNQTTNPALPTMNQSPNPPLAAGSQDTNQSFAPPLSGNNNPAANFAPGGVPGSGTNQGFVEAVLVTDAAAAGSNNNFNFNTNLTAGTSFGAGNGPVTDTRLVNPWGLVVGPGVEWTSDNGSGLATVYGVAGLSFANFDIHVPGITNLNSSSNSLNTPATNLFRPPPANASNFAGTNRFKTVAFSGVDVPVANGPDQGKPTGVAFNGTGQFIVTNSAEANRSGADTNNNRRSGPATFLIATEEGTIAGWDYFVTGSNAVVVVDNSASGAVYTGLAIAQSTNGSAMLYAANFHAGTIDTFDGNFKSAGSFTDTNLPAGYAPFNIKNISGELFVTFAKQDTNAFTAVAGPGNGYVDVFAPDGTLLASQFISQGALNAPWGMALAPFGFGPFSNALLVGNNGDGRINAYDLMTGRLLGHLTGPDGNDLAINGLWGLGFASELSSLGGFGFGAEQLYFTAGPSNGTGGILGTITFNGPSGPPPSTSVPLTP